MLGDLPFGSFTHPVSVTIRGLQPADRGSIAVTYRVPFKKEDTDYTPRDFEHVAVPQGEFSWQIPFNPIVELHITAPAEVLHRIISVRVDVGSRQNYFDSSRFAAAWQPISPFYEMLDQPAPSVVTLAWPSHAGSAGNINVRGPTEMLAVLATRAGLILAIVWGFCILLIATMKRRRDASSGPVMRPGESTALWLAAGFAVFCVGITIARSREAYAFTQDDNVSQFLPVIVRSAQEFFSGHFPVWNPHQLLGAPTATVGTYMLTYPPTYLSYWMADRVFHDPYLTLEIFIMAHLAAGYFITFWVLRRFQLRPSLAMAGALSFTLCAFLLIGGRSQATFVPVAVYLPLMAACVLALERGQTGWKWALATGAVIGIYYHAGHAQYWVYLLMFFGAAVGLLVLGGRVRLSQSLWCIPALCFGLAIAMPLLLPQMAELKGRHFGSSGTGVSLLGMLIPLGQWAPDWRQPLNQPKWGGETPYFGTTFAVASFLGIAYYFYLLVLCKLDRSHARKLLGEAVWLVLTLFAALLALGPDGVLWSVMAHVPPFADFRWPNKLLPFVAFFACVGGGLQLERWCSHWRPARLQCLAAVTVGLILLNTYWARTSWYTFGVRPYPALDPSYAALIAPKDPESAGRILTRPEWDDRSPVPEFFRTQSLNFPTVTGAMAIGGYDTFVDASPQNHMMLRRLYKYPLAAAQAYGVRWLIWDRLFSFPVFSPNPDVKEVEMLRMNERRAFVAVRDHSTLALATDGVRLYRLQGSDPLAFVLGPEKRPLVVHFDMRGATVDTNRVHPGSTVVVNVLWRPWMKAFADGLRVNCQADNWGRMVVPLTGSPRTLVVRYCPPWLPSELVGLGVGLLGCVWGLFLQRHEKEDSGVDVCATAVEVGSHNKGL